MRKNIFIQDISKLFFVGVMAVACICALVQMYAIPYRNALLMMMANRAMVFVWLLAAVIMLLVYGANMMKGTIFMLLMTVVAFSLSVADLRENFSGNLPSLLNFIVMPLMLIFFAYSDVDEIVKPMLLFTNIALSVLFIYLSRSSMAYRLEGPYFTVLNGDLSLGYPNPNQAAIYLFICALNLVVGFFYFKKKILKVLCAADFVYMLVLIEKTKCRTSLLLVVVFLALLIWRKQPKAMIDIFILTPLVYAVASHVAYAQFGDIQIMGETVFNGREEIFDRYFSGLDGMKFLIGDYARFKFDNLHNAYISVAATAGIVVLLFYIRMFRMHLVQNHKLGISRGYERVAFIGFLCIILYSTTEAAGLVGGTNYAFMNISLFAYFSKPFAKPDYAARGAVNENSGIPSEGGTGNELYRTW